MRSVDFPEANLPLAKDQPQYNTLYVHVDFCRPEKQMISCYELTEEEIADIVKNKKIWHTQMTFGNAYQPVGITTKNPFIEPIENYEPPADENRVSGELWDKTHYLDSHTTGVHAEMGPCFNCGKPFQAHFFSSRQCELNPITKC